MVAAPIAPNLTFSESLVVMAALQMFSRRSETGGDAVAQSAWDKTRDAMREAAQRDPEALEAAERALELEKRMGGLGQ